MSRTDIHRPGWVKERDPHMRRVMLTEHRHQDGPCDLDVWLKSKGWSHETRCYVRYIGSRNIYCGCRMCTMHDYVKIGNGKDRMRWRNDRQRLLRDPEHEPHYRRHPTW